MVQDQKDRFRQDVRIGSYALREVRHVVTAARGGRWASVLAIFCVDA